jgi:pyruvate formate lyase activating enzyme
MSSIQLYQKLDKKQVKCLACHNYCLIPKGKTGICGVRRNTNGDLTLVVDGKVAAVNLDPIEKKPLFHFLPGSVAFSLGTFGCNFACSFCQNWDISQTPKTITPEYWGEDWSPEKIVHYCQENNIPIIAYTYNEPTIWTEYALATMKLAKKMKIKNVWVSNGYMSDKTLKAIVPYLDAINVDLKGFTDTFYRKIVRAQLEPVKENIKQIWKLGIWEEVTTLVIPGLNDSKEELEQIAGFLVKISKNLPWHISAFYPSYKMLDRPSTPQVTLDKAYHIGKKAGLRYVYTGNIPNIDYESTYCPKCNTKVIERQGIAMVKNLLIKGKCPNCKTKLEGKWE